MASRAQAMAAAEQGAEVTVTVPYEEILTLPLPVGQGDYSDVQALCKHAGLSAKGRRNELERRVIEHAKEKLDAAPSASPERRDGRARSPKHGKAAAAVCASVVSEAAASKDADQKPESEMEIDSRLLNDKWWSYKLRASVLATTARDAELQHSHSSSRTVCAFSLSGARCRQAAPCSCPHGARD